MAETFYSFSDVGFDGFIPVLVPTFPRGGYRYTAIKIDKSEKAVRDFMLRCLISYMQSSGKTDFTNEFFGGIAYMLDGSLITIFNGMNGDEGKLFNRNYEPEYYQSVKTPEGVVVNSNKDYIKLMFNARQPKGLVLIQEIEGEDENAYSFRIIHETREDIVAENR